MSALEQLQNASEARPVVAIVGGAVAGSEAAVQCAKRGAVAVVFEQNARPYGKIEDGLPRWHEKLRSQEYARIDENLQQPGIHFVPQTKIGQDIAWDAFHSAYGFSAIVLANGAWRDRALPVDGVEAYVDKGLVYQNPFVYWFNHYHETNYAGPGYEIEDGSVVVGGGLASIDVVKIINLELYARALAERGITVDVVELEVKGIPRVLEMHGLQPEDLGVKGCTLLYRRRMEDMPLASMNNPTPAQTEKLQKARVKIMERVMRKYLVHFEALRRPAATIVEGGRLVGLKLQHTQMKDGRLQDQDGATSEVRAPMFVSSIGSVPEVLPGVPTHGELYHFESWDTGALHGLPGVFGLGNVLTGQGNIKDSRDNAVEIIENIVSRYLGVHEDGRSLEGISFGESAAATVDTALDGAPVSPQAQHKLAGHIQSRWSQIGYTDYASWIKQHATQ